MTIHHGYQTHHLTNLPKLSQTWIFYNRLHLDTNLYFLSCSYLSCYHLSIFYPRLISCLSLNFPAQELFTKRSCDMWYGVRYLSDCVVIVVFYPECWVKHKETRKLYWPLIFRTWVTKPRFAQDPAKRWSPGLVYFVPAVAYHFNFNLPEKSPQPWDPLFSSNIDMLQTWQSRNLSFKYRPYPSRLVFVRLFVGLEDVAPEECLRAERAL